MSSSSFMLPPKPDNGKTFHEMQVEFVASSGAGVSLNEAKTLVDDSLSKMQMKEVSPIPPPSTKKLLQIEDKIWKSRITTVPAVPNRRKEDGRHAIRPPLVRQSEH